MTEIGDKILEATKIRLEMPEIIAAWECRRKEGIGFVREWTRHTACCDVPDARAVRYILKSTVDAERTAESKTIAALAEALDYVMKHNDGLPMKSIDVGCTALSDNKERIAEAQDKS